jgi:predicted Zn-dependent protease with MMP-like domain
VFVYGPRSAAGAAGASATGACGAWAGVVGGVQPAVASASTIQNFRITNPPSPARGARKEYASTMAEVPPSLDDLDRLAREAWAALPDEFRALAGDVIFRIEDFADDATLADLGIDDPFELTGLYTGVDLTQRSMMDPAPQAPVVFLYRRAILDEWIERGDVSLSDLVAHVLVHEVGHHFGLSDEQMDALLDEAD